MKKGDRRSLRHSAKVQASGEGRRNKFYFGLRLKLDERPTKVTLARAKEEDGSIKLYPDPTNPEVGYEYKYGLNYFLKSQKRPRGFTVEWTPDENLIEAYREPEKYGFADRDEVAAGAWLKKFPAKPYFCVTGWVEEWFHLVEKEREKGEGTFVDRVRCEGRGCELCIAGWVKVFGNRFWMDLSIGQWLGPIDRVLEEIDRFPKDGGYVYPLHYGCSACKEILEFVDPKSRKEVRLDMTNNCAACGSENVMVDHTEHKAICEDCSTDWTLLSHEDDALKAYLDTPIKCSHCGHQDYPEPVWEHSEGLKKWKKSSIFDAQLVLYKTTESEKGGRLHVKKWEFREPDPRLFDPKFQGWSGDPKDKEGREMADKWVARHKQVLDLDNVHMVQDPDQVAEAVDLVNLFALPSKTSERPKYKPRTSRLKSK